MGFNYTKFDYIKNMYGLTQQVYCVWDLGFKPSISSESILAYVFGTTGNQTVRICPKSVYTLHTFS